MLAHDGCPSARDRARRVVDQVAAVGRSRDACSGTVSRPGIGIGGASSASRDSPASTWSASRADAARTAGSSPWHLSSLWVGSIALGMLAGLVAAAPLALRPTHRWIAVAALAVAGLLLVFLPWHPCACGLPGARGAGFGWFAYAPLNTDIRISVGTLWGRWAAGALLLFQTAVAAALLARRRRVL